MCGKIDKYKLEPTIMPAFAIRRDMVPAVEQSDAADEKIIARIRLVLALSIFLSVTARTHDPTGPVQALLASYALAAAALYAVAEADLVLRFARMLHWLDLLWCFLILNFGNTGPGFFNLFFVFVILSAAMRGGFDEGARVTIVGALSHVLSTLLNSFSLDELPVVFRQTVFLCALGYLVSQLGEQRLQTRRRFSLLRALAEPSNPRLGIDHVVTTMMERTRAFFQADRCLVVLGSANHGWTLRTVRAGGPLAVPAEPVDPANGAAFLDFPPERTLLYRRYRLATPLSTCPHERRHWLTQPSPPCERVADLLDADSFISVPVEMNHAGGRIYMSRRGAPFTRGDALFLSQAAAQALPVIQNVALLDRMASDAAGAERQRFALDVHDTAVQPYIGLAMGLSALRRKATPDNPLVPELDALGAMVQSVIADLRAYAGSVKRHDGETEDACAAALARLAHQMQERYRLHVELDIPPRMALGDRLMAEVVQIVREGLNNVGKHTAARNCMVRLQLTEHGLRIEIGNDRAAEPARQFVPHSITERAAVLGGVVQVRPGPGSTAVCVEIPT
jgi:signal transduction histidine kinase